MHQSITTFHGHVTFHCMNIQHSFTHPSVEDLHCHLSYGYYKYLCINFLWTYVVSWLGQINGIFIWILSLIFWEIAGMLFQNSHVFFIPRAVYVAPICLPPTAALMWLFKFMISNVYKCLDCMYVLYHVHVWCLWRSEESIIDLETGVTDGCGLTCGYWELNPDTL